MNSENKAKILITSALPYANGPLHFGHIAGAYLPADCYARFQRMQGADVLFVCGSDEYGVAITMSADLAGRTPQEHVDIFHQVNKSFFETLNISFDHYSRTTSPLHQAPVHAYFLDLYNNGYIEEKVTDQLFSEVDQRFLADRYVFGTCPSCGYENARGDECPKCGASYEATDLKNPRSKMTNAPLVKKPTKHWFLLLDKFKDKMTEWIESKDWKSNVANFAKEYIKDLRPRAITRDSKWGVPIPLPDTEGKVLYVWFDAPIGYISASMEWAEKQGDCDRWKDYWFDNETKLVQFIGKDNIPFHAAIFPAMTMGQNQPYKLVDELPANEFYNLEGRQFSKSEGWYIDLEDFFTKYTPDQIRYTIASNAPETQDSEYTWVDFQNRCNADLLGKYGNLVNRVLIFTSRNCNGEIPEKAVLEEVDVLFLEAIYRLTQEAADAYSNFKLRKASQIVMEIAQKGNIYFDGKQPWKDAKNSETIVRMQTTIACCMECLKVLAYVSYPIIPTTAQKVWRYLGFDIEIYDVLWRDIASLDLPKFLKLEKLEVLFNRVEDEQIEAELKTMKEKSDAVKQEKLEGVDLLKKNVNYSAFEQLDLRVGKILEAEKVPKSKKLLKLTVDLGFEKRTILSGISAHYKPEELIGKKVVVVANLEPATIMGIVSEGLVLTACRQSEVELIDPKGLPIGSVVR